MLGKKPKYRQLTKNITRQTEFIDVVKWVRNNHRYVIKNNIKLIKISDQKNMYNEPAKNTIEGQLSAQPTKDSKKHTDNYFEKYFSSIDQKIRSIETAQLERSAQLVIQTNYNGKKLFFVGNGGSAAMASHLSVDFLKTAGIRAMNFNEADLITCFSNDYGYEHWVERALDAYADPGDLVFIISSGGCSPNMLNAAYQARKIGLDIITATGFSSENPLRKLGDINLWVDSSSYNIVEMTHHVWLLSIVDYLVANKDPFL